MARLDGADTAAITGDAREPRLLHDLEGRAAADEKEDVTRRQLGRPASDGR